MGTSAPSGGVEDEIVAPSVSARRVHLERVPGSIIARGSTCRSRVISRATAMVALGAPIKWTTRVDASSTKHCTPRACNKSRCCRGVISAPSSPPPSRVRQWAAIWMAWFSGRWWPTIVFNTASGKQRFCRHGGGHGEDGPRYGPSSVAGVSPPRVLNRMIHVAAPPSQVIGCW